MTEFGGIVIRGFYSTGGPATVTVALTGAVFVGGLAAMLGLIAFALLILACSCGDLVVILMKENQQGDIEEGNNNNNNNNNNVGDIKLVEKPILEEKFLVIMAGQLKPTYIATPSLSSRASSFGSSSGCTASSESSTEKSDGEEKEMEEGNGVVSGSTLENNEGTSISGNDSSDNGGGGGIVEYQPISWLND
ncbi:hypothetical protein HAX54_041691 [Datura stramonium]|uniref:Uncharacterized protein n=1 Tax=Datura stramonium TaxID=4076 RepID=A0ABS8VZC2_DATST|nr:hypothetical protein [Datura stramonium]